MPSHYLPVQLDPCVSLQLCRSATMGSAAVRGRLSPLQLNRRSETADGGDRARHLTGRTDARGGMIDADG